MEYELIRSARKTLAVQIKRGRLIIRAPLQASDAQIRVFLDKHRLWIDDHLAQSKVRQAEADAAPKLTEAELHALAERAMQVIPQRVAYYALRIGVTYGKITIRNQHARWGSCSSKGNLSFNCLLMLAPPEVLDSVVVHELCHRREMNHSERFYAQVLRVFPEYWKWNAWLKDHGPALLVRNP